MKKCLKITIDAISHGQFAQDLQKKGTKLGVEGTMQYIADQKELRVVVCGDKEQVDQLVDHLHQLAAKEGISVHLEPYVKIKDYRGAFRIIE